MSWREWLFENFAGDLEYHPKRGYVYLGLSILLIAPWFLLPSESQLAMQPVFALGGVGLFGKAIYLFRKSSEGLGLTIHDEVALEAAAKRKKLRGFSSEVAQIVQDFGTGVLFLAPFFGSSHDRTRNSWMLTAMLIGASVFGVGWALRMLIRRTQPSG